VCAHAAWLTFEEPRLSHWRASPRFKRFGTSDTYRRVRGLCINGASGGVGTLAIQIARALGARDHAFQRSQHRVVSEPGIDEALDYRKDRPFDRR
jgi:NADPH:quinone reductase-like Zn-dependent oxidoreductase